MGCTNLTVADWLKEGVALGELHKYTPQEIKNYMAFINMCTDLEEN